MRDEELLEAWSRGDNDAGQALVARYLPSLTRFFNNKVRNPDDVAELVSETMLVCVRNKGAIRNGQAFAAFVFASAMNILRRHYDKATKRQRERVDFEAICVGESAHPRSLVAKVGLRQEVRLLVRALRRVSLAQQIVLELRFIEGLSGQEIAALLGIPAQTVYTRLRRGRERLGTIMAELAKDSALAQSTLVGLETWASRVRAQIVA